ncbi:MAG: hypothetical protein GWN53_17315 [Gammaproteobacteria bacterium]|uniref:Uncharacterized protein n=1 Tax=Candidatus Kutchimonas denitrificans TaxID=3056748 RepID=A0AAE4ZB44_9BACT|nr:hypothetical protein [Candidatus Kutchimonas denitrificans]NIV53602.1 hypothetical protein [Gammaproteobacteria bacterium]
MPLHFPSISWSGGNHTITFGTPVDSPRTFDHMEQTVARVPETGEQDSWTKGIFPRAHFDVRYVPASGSATDTGWNFPDPGWKAFKAHQTQNKDDFTFKPDKDSGGSHTCRLISFNERKEPDSGQHYRIEIEIEDVDGNTFDEY